MNDNDTLALKSGDNKTDTPPSPKRRTPIRVRADSTGKINVQSSPEKVAASLFGEGGDPAAAIMIFEGLNRFTGDSEVEINGNIALVVGLEPRNTAEAILAMQVVAANSLAVRLHGAAAIATDSRRTIDLARAALTASRTTGELLGRLADGRRPVASTQKIIVERVDGGQVAIACNTPEKGAPGDS